MPKKPLPPEPRDETDVPEPIAIPIEGTLDLHAFQPSDAADVVREYLDACHERGILDVRIVHGKGTGALQRTVEGALRHHPRVLAFRPADESGGGWGATLVTLKR